MIIEKTHKCAIRLTVDYELRPIIETQRWDAHEFYLHNIMFYFLYIGLCLTRKYKYLRNQEDISIYYLWSTVTIDFSQKNTNIKNQTFFDICTSVVTYTAILQSYI